MKQILLTQHGLHRVDFTDTIPMACACSLCGGDCPTPAACHLPEAAPAQRRRFPAASLPFLVGAAIAIPGAVFLVAAAIRHLLQS